MKNIKCICIAVVLLLILVGCSENKNMEKINKKEEYIFYVTSEVEDEDGIKYDTYDPIANLRTAKQVDIIKEEKQVQVGQQIYMGKFDGVSRFKYNNYWLERYCLEGEGYNEAFYKEGTNQLRVLRLSERPILKSEKPPTSEQELLALTEEVTYLCLGKDFLLSNYEVKINSHLNNLEDIYDFANNLEGFVSIEENADIDYYEIIYQKKMGEFSTEDIINIKVQVDGSVYSFTSYMIGEYEHFQVPKESRKELEEKALSMAIQRCTQQGEAVSQADVIDSSLLVSDVGKLVLKVDIEFGEESIERSNSLDTVSVYVVFP